MTDLDDRDPEADRRASRRAFLWAFGLCAGLPPLAMLVCRIGPLVEYQVAVAVLGVPALWLLALVVSGVLWAVDRERGPGAVIGVLAGVVVGFSLCSGALTTTASL